MEKNILSIRQPSWMSPWRSGKDQDLAFHAYHVRCQNRKELYHRSKCVHRLRSDLGNNIKVQNNVSVYDGVILEDDVFCGPSMVFTNVFNPRSFISRKKEFRKTLVRRGATIGANATVVCGYTIGQYAFIGAGSVVTKDVPDYALVYGNPGR